MASSFGLSALDFCSQIARPEPAWPEARAQRREPGGYLTIACATAFSKSRCNAGVLVWIVRGLR
jgi:hypothetical protein